MGAYDFTNARVQDSDGSRCPPPGLKFFSLFGRLWDSCEALIKIAPYSLIRCTPNVTIKLQELEIPR